MTAAATIGCLAAIALATGVAIAAGSNLALAVPAGAAAVTFATILGLYTVITSRESNRRTPKVPDIRPVQRLQQALRGDEIHREEFVLLLDQVERAGPNPKLPSRPHSEVAEIVSMKAPEFRRYVATRLDQLEREL